MSSGHLDRLLKPTSIAVIGGGAWCKAVLQSCRNSGFSGDLWAVHPTRDEVGGVKAYSSLDDLPGVPDAAFIGVNRNATIEIVQTLCARGAGGAVCFASGFREAISELADGDDLQRALLDAAGDMPILGPNCYGFINMLDRAALWPDGHGCLPVERGVAIISQSSNIALNLTMQTGALPIAYVIAVGNQAQIGVSAIGQALVADERVTAIGLYIEGIDDLAAFQDFAVAARAGGKPVIVLKAGKSEHTRQSTLSHTASIAGSSAGSEALFRRLGVGSISSLPDFMQTLMLLHMVGPLPSHDIICMSCSGGEANLVADLAEGRDVGFPPLTDRQKATLRQVLGPKVALANPLDYHTYIWGDGEAQGAMFSALCDGHVALSLAIVDMPRADRCDDASWHLVMAAAKKAATTAKNPLAIVSSIPETLPEALCADLSGAGVIPMRGLTEALTAVEIASTVGRTLNDDTIHLPASINKTMVLSEADAKAALSDFGVPVPASRIVVSPEEAGDAADAIGFPVVVKATGLAHKTEAGGVALNLSTRAAVIAAAKRIGTDQLLVEQMVSGTIVELLVGVVRDPAHGMVLTLASGGVMTELLADRASLIVPASEDEINVTLQSLRIAPRLAGYRGAPACDIAAIKMAIAGLQRYVMANRIAEVEINPLLCGADFAIAADALIKIGEHE